MRMNGVLALLLFFGSQLCSCQKLKSFASIDLHKIGTPAEPCEVKWYTLVNQVIWIDDEHLVASLFHYCSAHEQKDRRSSSELIFIGTPGGTKSLPLEEMSGVSRGPSGSVLIRHGNVLDLVGPDLKAEQTIECRDQKPCAVFDAPPGYSDSDFAICTETKPTQSCDFYKGLPAARLDNRTASVPMLNGILPRSPYEDVALSKSVPNASYGRAGWKVNKSDSWYFDNHGTLTSSESGSPVTQERWTPKDCNCTGDLSVSEPRRFLATCIGTHFYTDGDLDFIFGYSRIALFDVASHRILRHIDGPAYTSAVLSPNGKQIAVTHLESMSLFRVD